MKKFFALVLAVAMIMSMAAVSFAANVYGPFDYDADKDLMRTTGIQYGDTVYFLLSEANKDKTEVAMSDFEQVEKLKVKVAYEMGEDMVESVSIVKKYVSTVEMKKDADGNNTSEFAAKGLNLIDTDDYYYFVAVKVKNSTSVGDVDIIGTFELKRKEIEDDKNATKWAEIDEEEFDFEINVSFNNGWLKKNTGVAYGGLVINDDKNHLEWDTSYALKFDYDDEVELSFGEADSGDNEGTFTVDVSGQGKLFLRYDTKLADAIAEANPGVKIYALNFNGVKFNRVGEFAYELEDGVAAYKVVDGALVEIPGCEYDESDETFYFNTRVLENYVFATAELVNPVAEAPVVEAAPVAPSNPSTGA